MKPRVADTLKSMGCNATIEEFRTALADIKFEHYGDLTDEDLAFSRHQAEDFCSKVRERVGCRKLPRVFLLRQLVNLRKNAKQRKAEAIT